MTIVHHSNGAGLVVDRVVIANEIPGLHLDPVLGFDPEDPASPGTRRNPVLSDQPEVVVRFRSELRASPDAEEDGGVGVCFVVDPRLDCAVACDHTECVMRCVSSIRRVLHRRIARRLAVATQPTTQSVCLCAGDYRETWRSG